MGAEAEICRKGLVTNIGGFGGQASRLGMQLKAVEVAFHACS